MNWKMNKSIELMLIGAFCVTLGLGVGIGIWIKKCDPCEECVPCPPPSRFLIKQIWTIGATTGITSSTRYFINGTDPATGCYQKWPTDSVKILEILTNLNPNETQ